MGPALGGEAAVGYQQHLPHHPALLGVPTVPSAFPSLRGRCLLRLQSLPAVRTGLGHLGKNDFNGGRGQL